MPNLTIVGPLHDGDGMIKRRLETGGLAMLARIAEQTPILISATRTESSKAIEDVLKGTRVRFVYEPVSKDQEPDTNVRIKENYLQCLSHESVGSGARLFIGIDRLVFAAHKYPRELNKMIRHIKARVNKPDFRNEVFLTVNRESIKLDDLIYESENPWITLDVSDGFSFPFHRPFPWRDWGGDAVTYPYSQVVPEAILTKAYSMSLGQNELLDMGSGAWVLSETAALDIVRSQGKTNMRFPEGEWPFIVKSHGGMVGSAGRFGKILEWEHDPDGTFRWNEGVLRVDPTLEWLRLFDEEKYKGLVNQATQEFLVKATLYLKNSNREGVQSGPGLESLR